MNFTARYIVSPSHFEMRSSDYDLSVGFSDRFNILLDNIDFDVPPIGAGRKIWISRTFGVSPAIANKWLRQDNIPRRNYLKFISDFIFSFLPSSGRPQLSKDVECYLVYSTSAKWSPSPRNKLPTHSIQDQSLPSFRRDFSLSNPNIRSDDLSAGFSNRFNILLDNIDIKVPSIAAGRKIWIARTFGVTPGVSSNWLLNDTIPRRDSLKLIADFVFCYLPTTLRPLQCMDVECYLVYSYSSKWSPSFD